MADLSLSAPWYTYRNKLAALFQGDTEVFVSALEAVDNSQGRFTLTITSTNHEKAEALDKLLRKYRKFGNVEVQITIVDDSPEKGPSHEKLYEALFNGNPLFHDLSHKTIPGGEFAYVRFKPEVVQVYADDMSDYDGNWSGLAQQIAKDIFFTENDLIYFCTAPVWNQVKSDD